MEQAHRLPEPLELPPALGAIVHVALHGHALLARERIVQERREELARVVVAGHRKKRSILSLRSIRARCSRERTVPSSRSRAWAISS